MAPPPDSAAEVRSPCWRRAIHRTNGQRWRHINPGPAGGSFLRQARRQPIREPSRNPVRPTVLLHRPPRWRIVTDHPLSATPAVGVDRPPSTYSLPTMRSFTGFHFGINVTRILSVRRGANGDAQAKAVQNGGSACVIHSFAVPSAGGRPPCERAIPRANVRRSQATRG